MPQFIAINKRDYDRFSEADFTPEMLAAEAEVARTLYAEGKFRQLWGHKAPAGAIVLLEAADLADATAICNSLPLAQKGMLKIEIIEVGPYRGFGPRQA
jgi:muconolactone delta-isomerase